VTHREDDISSVRVTRGIVRSIGLSSIFWILLAMLVWTMSHEPTLLQFHMERPPLQKPG
jgi:hypothetical protein